MSNIRRWYFYIISALSLQVMTWAIIVLLRNRTIDSLAFQTAVIIVSLPLYLLHWRWATQSEAEVDAVDEDYLRVLYLFTMLAAFLLPLIFNVRGLLEAAMRALLDTTSSMAFFVPGISNSEDITNAALTIVVLGALGLYHLRLLREENLMAEEGPPATIRRLFVYLFAAIGLFMFSFGVFRLLGWLRREFDGLTIVPAGSALVSAVGLILSALPVWIYFWHYAQRLFSAGRAEERASALRKAYLTIVVFVGTILVVSDLTIIGATLIRRVLGLEPLRDSGIVLASLIVGAFLWAYHAYVLMEDSRAAPVGEAQSSIRRVYWYLVATTGLLALLVGLGSLVSVIINALGRQGGITFALREQLAWSTAGLLAGLVVWLLPWRSIQREVALPAPLGINARGSGARRYYLYGFIFLATLTFLVCIVYLVYAVLAQILGVRGVEISFTQAAHALAFGLMAVAVWLFHGSNLRADDAELKEAKSPFGDSPTIVILDDGDGRLAQRLKHKLAIALPEAELQAVGLTAEARSLLEDSDAPPAAARIGEADVIVASWTAVTPTVGRQPEDPRVISLVAASPARKVLIPTSGDGWQWSGLDPVDEETALRQALQAVKQVVTGEPVRLKKAIGVWQVLLIIGGLIAIILLIQALVSVVLGV